MTDFDAFWKAYPFRTTPSGKRVKVGKAEAQEQYDIAIKSGVSHERLYTQAVVYGECQDPRFVKDAHRWIKKKGYDDEYDTTSSSDERLREGLYSAVMAGRAQNDGSVPGKPGDGTGRSGGGPSLFGTDTPGTLGGAAGRNVVRLRSAGKLGNGE